MSLFVSQIGQIDFERERIYLGLGMVLGFKIFAEKLIKEFCEYKIRLIIWNVCVNDIKLQYTIIKHFVGKNVPS